jgi:hypothetical protein
MDQNLRYQQTLVGRNLAIMVLSTTSWPKIQWHLPAIITAVEAMQRGNIHEVVFAD